MNLACFRPIVYNFTYLLSSCSAISDLCRGSEVHSLLISNGIASNIFAMTVVVNMYTKCCQMEDARKMFDRMPVRDLVAWNTVVSGYSQNGLALQALDTVLRLQADGKMCEGLIQKAKDGGLDVVEMNIFWNGHEPSPGSYNFEGRYDLVRFIKTVQNAGLYAHISIGPHVFTKWNFGAGLYAHIRIGPHVFTKWNFGD